MSIKLTTAYRVSALVAAMAIAGCGSDAKTQSDFTKVDTQAPVDDWELVWSDEFDSDAIDEDKWTFEVNCDGGGNNEKQCYTDSADNAFISDGMLNLVALPAEEGATLPYTSARLNTRYKADFKYGRIEMRAKLPFGQGAWPAFWMMPTDEVYGGWPRSGEIDIMEAVNLKVADEEGNLENQVYGTLHYGQVYPDNVHTGKAYAMSANPADDFHTYAVEWQEGEIRWYVDGYLYETQRQSEVRYNSKGEAAGLAHRGWFAEYYDIITGELTTHWDAAPFDQSFYLILNLAVGGDWPENVNNLGVNESAFTDGQSYQIDYVRVYQCGSDPDTGKGCETVRSGYDSLDDALVEGEAPIPSVSSGVAASLTIFDNAINPNWPAWDCCGGSTPGLVTDADKGEVMQFVVGATPTVNGFTSREEFITDPEGQPSPFDASGILEQGTLSFAMKVSSAPNDTSAAWLLKVESQGASSYAELNLTASNEGVAPVTGEWQTYTFPVQTLADAGLDVSAIDVVMIFPAWGAGEGAEYLVDDLIIAQPSPELIVFEDGQNLDWPMWDCCGGSTPTEEIDDAEHGLTAEFSIGASPTVMGFITRTANGGGDTPFDASAIAETGVLQFDMKLVSAPTDTSAAWLLKLEANDASTSAEVSLSSSQEGLSPVAGEWQTYTFMLSDLADAGLDLSAIDVIMVFPAWGQGEGATYRLDNVKIYDAGPRLTLFKDGENSDWPMWDCCAGSTPEVVTDDASHGATAEFSIGASATVMGFITRSANGGGDKPFDASAIVETGVLRFDMKVVSAPNDSSAPWLVKLEANDASTAAEVNITTSEEGIAPVTGEWQTYTFKLQDLYDAGLDVSAIDVVMVFPAWGQGEGAVYRIDNAEIAAE